MRFIPDYKTEILSEENFTNAIADLEYKIKNCMESGYFKALDNTKIYYEYFLAKESRASVVIVHGLSEFTKKFYELIYYFLNRGLNVFIYDQRCHGLSGRLTDNKDLLHVDSFNDYVNDLSQFIDEIVVPTEDKPIYLFTHSMGGAVGALYLAKHSEKIKKAVFSAPMFEPIVESVPKPIAKGYTALCRFLFGAKSKFSFSKEFNPDVKYKKTLTSSKARFEHNMKLRRENSEYQSTPMSFGWVHNSLNIRSKILKRRVVENIKTPILIISAAEDETVCNKAQEEFVKKCPLCTLTAIEDVNHSLLAADNKTMARLVALITDYFA